MEKVIYRSLKKEDFEAVGDIICSAFHLQNYVKNEKVLKSFKMSYVYNCLSEATKCIAAEKDGKVEGIIMGKANKAYSLPKHLTYIAKAVYYNVKMTVSALIYRENAKDFKKLHKIYAGFLKETKENFNGVFTLFAVNENLRGLGVGKTLLSLLSDHWKENGTSYVYLFTDTTCNYGFYDSHGFKRLSEKPLTVISNGQPMDMTIFFYGYEVK